MLRMNSSQRQLFILNVYLSPCQSSGTMLFACSRRSIAACRYFKRLISSFVFFLSLLSCGAGAKEVSRACIPQSVSLNVLIPIQRGTPLSPDALKKDSPTTDHRSLSVARTPFLFWRPPTRSGKGRIHRPVFIDASNIIKTLQIERALK